MSLREKIESLRCERSFTTKYKGPDRALERLAYDGALDDVLALMDKCANEKPTQERAWLIERLYSNTLYYFSVRGIHGINGITLGRREYSKDANDALRFSREEDAMVALYHLCDGDGRVAEHVFMGAKS